MTRWGEIKCPRCAELEAQITAMEEGLTAVHMAGYMDGKKAAEAKMAQQDDLVHAAVAAALREAAQAIQGDEMLSPIGAHRVSARILTLIPEDAQAALDRVVAAERERIALHFEEKLKRGEFADSGADELENCIVRIRKGGE